MTRKGEAELALGAGVWFSAVGGIAGTPADDPRASARRNSAVVLDLRILLAALLGLMRRWWRALREGHRGMFIGSWSASAENPAACRDSRLASPTCSAASSRSRRWSASSP
jgi:hypothetical protein